MRDRTFLERCVQLAICMPDTLSRDAIGSVLDRDEHVDVTGTYEDFDQAVEQLAIGTHLLVVDADLVDVSRAKQLADLGVGMIRVTDRFKPEHLLEASRIGMSHRAYVLLSEVAGASFLELVDLVSRGLMVSSPAYVAAEVMPSTLVGDEARPLPELTPGEADMIRLVAEGCNNKQIAATLDLSEGTVRAYLSKTYVKLHVGNRIEAGELLRERLEQQLRQTRCLVDRQRSLIDEAREWSRRIRAARPLPPLEPPASARA